jgi:mannan endo-1,4-beta-mannosidase
VIQAQSEPTVKTDGRGTTLRVGAVVSAALVIVATAIVVLTTRTGPPAAPKRPISYLGLYERGMPTSFDGVTAFTAASGVAPDVVVYYSAWSMPFQASFAATAAEHGAVPLVQINPFNVNLTAIAGGQYDSYLSAYADAVRSYHRPVILSFGHEMNGHWYSWGYTHTSSAAFVGAWRHIVTLFRTLGVQNVTWLWTVNIIDTQGAIPNPTQWWPGSSYVNWVGLDGYYYDSSWTFTSLFGPTIAAVRELTPDPILITETGAAAGPDQSAKIADLFAGVRTYGLLGFVYFNAEAGPDWRLSTPSAIAAYHRGAEAYQRSTP